MAKQHGSMAALFFCLNAIVGAGFLGMPYVLYQGGVLYGLFLVAIIAVLAIAAAEWTIESMARAESYTSAEESGKRRWRILLVSNDRKFEVGEMCRLFIHPIFGHIYDVTIIFNGFIVLWIYGTLAGSSWSTEIPFSGSIFRQCDSSDYLHKNHPEGGCWNAYSLCLLIYGAIVIPLSCLDLHSQVIFQTVMGIFRIVVITSMSVYSLAGAILNEVRSHSINGSNGTSHVVHSNDTQRRIWLQFNFKQWFGVIPVVSFALMVHFMIPTFCQSVNNKKHLRRIFTIALTLATVLYVLVGVTVAMFFGGKVEETCTLTWASTTKPGHSAAIRAYSYLLVVFPSIDLCSGYPLIVNVLINILFSMLTILSNNKLDLKGTPVRIGRFCMATVPLIGSIYTSNLVAVADYSGVFLTLALFFVPALLHFFSKWKSVRTFGHHTPTENADDEDGEDGSIQTEQHEQRISLLNSSDGTMAVGKVANCYRPILGHSVVAVGSIIFGVVALVASGLSWVSKH